MARQYPAYYPNTLLLDNALATMGAGVPSAMAAKIVHPEVCSATPAKLTIQQRVCMAPRRLVMADHD